MLVGIISEDEVKKVVWNCDNSKSPGPDGFNFGFIKFCWDILKGDVVRAVQSFAEGWKLAERLKRVQNKVIDPRQFAFSEGRGLLDSVLVANETLEEVKRKKKECVVFKVDYEKAYDSVSWEFIYYMLGRLGFCGKWIEWIKNSLEISSIPVLVNGSPTTEFEPLKGLRQGDHLASFLFLIAAEGLAGVVRQAEEKMLVESIEVGKKRVKVSMLQYADDTLFFCKASIQGVLTLKAIPKCFELASGLKVNYSKSKVGVVENRKIAWVAWDKICQSKDKGGLGVIDIGKFNLALLGKWIWRLKSEERIFWKDILDSKYGGWRGLRSHGQSCKDSIWWRDLRKVWNLEEWGNDFEERDTGRTLSEVGVWNNNNWSWKLRWRRNLFVWESSLVDLLMHVLDNKRLTREGGFKPDKWLWRDVVSINFSVKAAYNILLGEESVVDEELFTEFWTLKSLPSTQFTAWRVLCNVIPTKDNLLRCGLPLMSDRCPLCGVEEESVLGGIWVGIVSEIWNHRNMVVFENGRVDLVEVFTVVQRKTWSWVIVKEKLTTFSYSDWCLEPHCCMRFHRVLPPNKVGLRFGRVGLMILFLDCGKGCVFDFWEVVVCFLQDISDLCILLVGSDRFFRVWHLVRALLPAGKDLV
ncbi:uncharacterized protein [Phaseolus vulgaris]|uniref:uncharacterized protein n=1 Tax=Phaseolus vulgaris TaxID=3885 RepID=UPI0035CA0C0C